MLTLALLPAIGAVWLVPGFVTQDGPAHLYNAYILRESLRGSSPLADTYEVRWAPLPNWAGHLALAGLMAAGASPWVADRVVMSATLVGLAAAITWLRWRVRGARGLPTAALLAILLALNVTWLLGFSSFLLGACLFPVTLAVWWDGRARPGPGRATAIAALLVVAYFAHIVSLGLIAVGLVTLAAATPGAGPIRRRRWLWTLAGLAPMVPLGLLYRAIASDGGPVEPLWMELEDPLSPASWWTRLVWVDPLTLGSKVAAPFAGQKRAGFALLAPVLWAMIGLVALAAATVVHHRRSAPCRDAGAGTSSLLALRGWMVLAVLLTVGGVVGPDTFGERHGNYLSQRVVLLGLIALVPLLDLVLDRPLAWIGAGALGIAVAVQSAFVWDYALRSDAALTAFLRATPHVGRGDRLGALMLDLRPAFRANPLRHAGALLGVDTGGIVWSNYEAAHYYFPVRVREDVAHPPVLSFEEVSVLDAPSAAAERARLWAVLLARHHPTIDLLVVWGDDPHGLDPITALWFEPVAREGPLRVLRRKDAARTGRPRVDRVAWFGPPWGRVSRGAGVSPPSW